jgi:phosphoheptose isomerase
MSHTQTYLAEAREVIERIDVHEVEKMVCLLRAARDSGARIFFLGVGGSAANASHAVNDFRKIVGFEAYAPTDNVSELTARINDDGWNSVFANWLKGSRLTSTDVVFVFSVGGGDLQHNVSQSCSRVAVCKRSWRNDFGRRRTQWRLHCASRRCVRHRAECESQKHNALYGGISSRYLAFTRFTS